MDLVGRDGKEDNNGGFQYVARKSKASRKRRKGKEDANSDDEEKKLAKRIDIISAQKVFLSTGATGESIKALLDDVFSSKCKDQWPSSILTLGLGSVKDSRVAQIQLAFLILVRDKLQSKESQGIVKVEAYDPIFEAEDEQLLHAYGIETSSTNLQGNYVLDHSVFIFMPHCTKTLYENILRSNWNPTALNRLWLCCNELARYVDDRRDAESTTPCIQRYGKLCSPYQSYSFRR
jgi:hypothetical protein